MRGRRLGRAGVIAAGTLAFALSGGGAALAGEDGNVLDDTGEAVQEITGDLTGEPTAKPDGGNEPSGASPKPSDGPVRETTDQLRRAARKVGDLISGDSPSPSPEGERERSPDSREDQPARDSSATEEETRPAEAPGTSGSSRHRRQERAERPAARTDETSSGTISLPNLESTPALGPLRLLSSTPSLDDRSEQQPLPLPRLVDPPNPPAPPPSPQLAGPQERARGSGSAHGMPGTGTPPHPTLLAAAATAVGAVTGGHIGVARLRRRVRPAGG